MSEAVVIGVPPDGPDLTRFWWAPFAAGILTMLCGFVALVFPEPTLKVVGFLFGVYLILWGFVILLRALMEPDAPGVVARILFALLGALSIVVGFVVMTRPGESVLTLAWILGFWWFAAGVVHLARGIAHAEGRGINIFEGLIGIVGGIIILDSPHIGVVTLLVILGVGLLLQGAAEIAVGWQMRKLNQAVTS